MFSQSDEIPDLCTTNDLLYPISHSSEGCVFHYSINSK